MASFDRMTMKNLIQLEKIYKRYGTRVLLDDAHASFCEGQKIGIIGRNGAGKSTLCRIITGEEEADDGKVVKSKDLRLSYLQQHDPYKMDETVNEFLMRSSGKEEWECGMVAGKFQLQGETLEKKIGSLPGGFRTRVKLTSMLLADPNFLILDEPTNYLDLKTLILLENFLQDFEGGFLIVSHDREFLKRTCEETLEIENAIVTVYPGKVEDYFEFKELQQEQAASHNRQVELKKKQLEAFVERFRAKASKATQAKSKMKQLERLETIKIEHGSPNAKIRIPAVEKRNGIALRVQDLTIGYPDKKVAERIHLEVNQGAHVAVVGDNGQGKTTFLRTIAGDLQLKHGEFKWGHNLQVAYYAQHVFSQLNESQQVLDHLVAKAAPGITRQEILNVAASFLFRGDDVQKKIKVLSGGERARLVLAGLLLTKSQILLLDEPTNHLDFETVEALANSLQEFQGTVFFTSHDRTFVSIVATEIIDVKNGKVVKYPGTFEDYVWKLEQMAQSGEEEAEEPEAPKQKTEYELKKEKASEVTRLNTQLKKLERALELLREEKHGIEMAFAQDPKAWSREKSDRLNELNRLIDEEELRCFEIREKIENPAKA